MHLALPLATNCPPMGEAIQELAFSLKNESDGALLEMPDIDQYGIPLEEALSWVNPDARGLVEALYNLQGLVARVRVENKNQTTLQYADILPDDLAPMLILDASGQQRSTYELWARDRKGIKFLLSPQKSYDGLTVHHWDTGAGKRLHQRIKSVRQLALGIARTIDQIPENKEVLVIHFLQKNGRAPSIVQEITRALTTNLERVRFCNWGRHTATNDFKDVEHVVLGGVLQYNNDQYEATGLAAKGQGIKSPLSKEEFSKVRLGEVSHHILQAACRGKVRHSAGTGCPENCHLYIVYSTKPPTGLPGAQLMQRVFPGSAYQPWEPVVTITGRKQLKLVDLIESKVKQGSVTKAWLVKELGLSKPNLLDRMFKTTSMLRFLQVERGIFLEEQEGGFSITKLGFDF